jgi:hypothetical protein
VPEAIDLAGRAAESDHDDRLAGSRPIDYVSRSPATRQTASSRSSTPHGDTNKTIAPQIDDDSHRRHRAAPHEAQDEGWPVGLHDVPRSSRADNKGRAPYSCEDCFASRYSL